MAVAPDLVAYPLLLGSIYAIYRVGRARGVRPEGLEWARVVALAVLLGVVVALHVRYVGSGHLDSPLGLVGATLSIAAVFGLVGLNLIDLLRARDARRSAARHA